MHPPDTMHIIKLSGSLCHDARPLADIDPPAVIVHGGGPQLDAAWKGQEVRRIAGLRVTDEKQAWTVARTMDAIGDGLADQLRALGHQVVRVRAGDRLLGGRVLDPRLGRVGEITTVPELGKGIVVVTPVAWDAHGPLNVNADDAATAIAAALGAETLTFLSDVEGVLKDGRPLAQLDVPAAQACIEDGTAAGGMVPKLKAAMAAAEAGTAVRIGAPACLTDPAKGTRIDPVEVAVWR